MRQIQAKLVILCLARPCQADPTSTMVLARGCELALALVSAQIAANQHLDEWPETRWEGQLFMRSHDDIRRDCRFLFLLCAPVTGEPDGIMDFPGALLDRHGWPRDPIRFRGARVRLGIEDTARRQFTNHMCRVAAS